jgi:environmental stress-induced protein Ves
MLQKLTKDDYIVSSWSGGTTTQLAIFPPGARYADRNFLWRVSSATVELDESDFTPLPDYDRLISTLEGEIVLTHNGGAPIRLRPFEIHAFSGADATHSTGRCTDFNLMLRHGKAAGSMELLKLTETPTVLSAAAHSLRHDAAEQLLLCCIEGTAQINQIPLAPGETLLLSGETNLKLTGPAMLMLCRMRRL